MDKKRWHWQADSFGSSRGQGAKKQKIEERVLGPEFRQTKVSDMEAEKLYAESVILGRCVDGSVKNSIWGCGSQPSAK